MTETDRAADGASTGDADRAAARRRVAAFVAAMLPHTVRAAGRDTTFRQSEAPAMFRRAGGEVVSVTTDPSVRSDVYATVTLPAPGAPGGGTDGGGGGAGGSGTPLRLQHSRALEAVGGRDVRFYSADPAPDGSTAVRVVVGVEAADGDEYYIDVHFGAPD